MSGAHSRPDVNPLLKRFDAAGWYPASAVLAIVMPLGFLALIGGVVYLAVAVPASDQYILMGIFGLLWIRAAIELAKTLRRAAVAGPERRLDLAAAGTWLLVTSLLLLRAVVREHGSFSSVSLCLGCALALPLLIYWLGGKGYVIAAMQKRAAMRDGRTA